MNLIVLHEYLRENFIRCTNLKKMYRNINVKKEFPPQGSNKIIYLLMCVVFGIEWLFRGMQKMFLLRHCVCVYKSPKWKPINMNHKAQ